MIDNNCVKGNLPLIQEVLSAWSGQEISCPDFAEKSKVSREMRKKLPPELVQKALTYATHVDWVLLSGIFDPSLPEREVEIVCLDFLERVADPAYLKYKELNFGFSPRKRVLQIIFKNVGSANLAHKTAIYQRMLLIKGSTFPAFPIELRLTHVMNRYPQIKKGISIGFGGLGLLIPSILSRLLFERIFTFEGGDTVKSLADVVASPRAQIVTTALFVSLMSVDIAIQVVDRLRRSLRPWVKPLNDYLLTASSVLAMLPPIHYLIAAYASSDAACRVMDEVERRGEAQGAQMGEQIERAWTRLIQNVDEERKNLNPIA